TSCRDFAFQFNRRRVGALRSGEPCNSTREWTRQACRHCRDASTRSSSRESPRWSDQRETRFAATQGRARAIRQADQPHSVDHSQLPLRERQHLPASASFKEKFWMATQDSFDYSAFIYAGIISGMSMAGKSEPEFDQGAAGYGNYFAHTFADDTIENYMVETFVPALTKEDPRYYTLGKGGFFKRSGYALSRLL